MADALTANFSWVKPAVNDPAGANLWGGKLNSDLDGIDSTVFSVQTTANAAYPASNPSGYQTAANVTASLAPYAPLASPTFTGTPALPTGTTGVTQTAGNNSTALATTAFVAASFLTTASASATYAPLASPAFTGTPSLPTGTTGVTQTGTDNSTKLATTAFVANNFYLSSNPSGYQTAAQVTASLGNYLPLAGGTLTGALSGTSAAWSTTATATTGFTTTNGTVSLSRSVFTVPATVSPSAGAMSIAWTAGEYCPISLTSNSTLAVTGWPTGFAKLVLDISNTGAFNITAWPTGTIWAGAAGPPTITSGSGKRDVVMLMTANGGTTILGSVVGQNYG
jgi:hypothetical protein